MLGTPSGGGSKPECQSAHSEVKITSAKRLAWWVSFELRKAPAWAAPRTDPKGVTTKMRFRHHTAGWR
jgi:hypothetical protein